MYSKARTFLFIGLASYVSATASETCAQLQQAFSNVLFPGDGNYTVINEDYFDSAAWLGPSCIAVPASAQEMAQAINIVNDTQTTFGIRSGGHMPIANAANVNSSGVLLATSGLNQLILSDDKTTIEVGSGNIWSNVYQFLEPYQLVVVGGRAGLVGVGGFLLGGGLSFFGNQYGWASANVVQFDGVLANGTIFSATPKNDYSDLFWALRGGGNSFAIITAFHLKTFPLPEVTIGQVTYGQISSSDYLDYVYGYALNGSQDHKSGMEPLAVWAAALSSPTYLSILFYDGADISPAAFYNFTEVLKPVASTFEVRPSMYNWTQEADSQRQALDGLRAEFNVISINANREALTILHDTYLGMAQLQLADVKDMVASIVFIPIIDSYITASTINGGDPMSVSSIDTPYIWAEETMLWSDAADDARVMSFLADFNANITTQLTALGDVIAPFKYLNYAGENQEVFEGYGVANVQRLKDIRGKYDPSRVYTNLMSGGWKVDRAGSRTAKA